MKLRHTLRLSLYQFWLGAVSVLMLGTLNRILRVEMGLDLALVGLVLGGAHYLAALVAIPIGHRSDVRAYLGYHRLPYIVAGTALAVLTVVAAPFVARFSSPRTPASRGWRWPLLSFSSRAWASTSAPRSTWPSSPTAPPRRSGAGWSASSGR